ncbi:MAG: carboxypeptidase-like regulatory domain-containing protein, partial [Ferruginibacter sp.]
MLKLKYSFLILVFLSSGSLLYAQNALTGTVISAKSGLPVYAASVSINDLKLTVLTDTSGKYAFKNLPNGNFIVQVQSIGYKSAVQNIPFKS